MITGTTVVRRSLGRRLRRLRDLAGFTVDQVTAADGGSEAKIWRIEHGKVAVKVETALHLATLYGASDEERQVLAALARATGQQGWWQEFGASIPDWFQLFVGLESEAGHIAAWDSELVPGLLQTPDYARAVFQAAADDGDPDEVERQVAVRVARQQRMFDRVPAPRLCVVLGQGVMARLVGGPRVMAAQVHHMCSLDQRPDVEIRWLPFACGAHPAMKGGFRILSFEHEDDPDPVYVEAEAGAQYLEKIPQVTRYRGIFESIAQRSIPIGEYQ